MKNNIDLTSNRMFSRVVSSQKIVRMLKWRLKGASVDDRFYAEEPQLVHTGNKEQRRYRRELDTANSEDFCDCCGAYLKRLPYEHRYGLCAECTKDMEQNYGNRKTRFPPGKIDTGMIRQRSKNPFRF